MKIKVNDIVQVIAGKDKGKTGKVLQVFPAYDRASVEGVNLAVKHLRSSRAGEKGQKIQFPSPIHISNLMMVDPKSKKVTRVGYKKLENGKKVRIAKKSGEQLP